MTEHDGTYCPANDGEHLMDLGGPTPDGGYVSRCACGLTETITPNGDSTITGRPTEEIENE